ncbi:hypothetical protein ABBQ38_000158 [Trebouxia sp. C0009 RCD-2024]
MERRIAFCVKHWSSDATLYSWTWAKQYFLRKHIDETGAETLSQSDKLYVVHVKQGKDSKERAWSAGGPVLPSLQLALARYPHTIVELEGSHTYSVLLDFTARTNIDVLILGGKESSNSMLNKLVPGQMALSQHLNSKAACLVIRPASARNDKMRINSQRNLGAAGEHAGGGPGARASLPQHMKANMLTATAADADLPRKVVIAYDSFDVGRQMLTWAAKYCLAAEDQVFLLQYQVSQKGKKGDGGEDGGSHLEPDDLMGLTVSQHVSLRGDAKAQMCDFCEDNSVDLLVVTSTVRGRIKKALSPMGGVSSQLVLEAPCPVLVLPTQAASFQEQNASLGSGELQTLAGGNYELSTSPDSQGTNTSPQGRGPFQKFSSRKTRSGELPRRHSATLGTKDAAPPTSPQESGGSMPQPQATPFSHSNTWGPRAGPLQGAAASALASGGSGPLVSRAAPPSTPPQQTGGQPHGVQQDEAGCHTGSWREQRASLSAVHSQSISANIDLIAKLRRQLEERDAEIVSLKNQVHTLQLGQSYPSGHSQSPFSSQPMLT